MAKIVVMGAGIGGISQVYELRKELGKEHNIDLVVCIAAALRRGIKEEVLQDGFRISGLGQLVEAGIENDRLVVFGD